MLLCRIGNAVCKLNHFARFSYIWQINFERSIAHQVVPHQCSVQKNLASIAHRIKAQYHFTGNRKLWNTKRSEPLTYPYKITITTSFFLKILFSRSRNVYTYGFCCLRYFPSAGRLRNVKFWNISRRKVKCIVLPFCIFILSKLPIIATKIDFLSFLSKGFNIQNNTQDKEYE